MLPRIQSYGNYSSDNYGVNSLVICFEEIQIFYSYKTIVAYQDNQDDLVCCENSWSVTTGKHLNWIQPDKSKRLPYNQFQDKLHAALERHIK